MTFVERCLSGQATVSPAHLHLHSQLRFLPPLSPSQLDPLSLRPQLSLFHITLPRSHTHCIFGYTTATSLDSLGRMLAMGLSRQIFNGGKGMFQNIFLCIKVSLKILLVNLTQKPFWKKKKNPKLQWFFYLGFHSVNTRRPWILNTCCWECFLLGFTCLLKTRWTSPSLSESLFYLSSTSNGFPSHTE